MDLKLRNQCQKPQIKQKPLLGVDWGIRFCGLAFSPDGVCVFPLVVIEQSELEQTIKKIIKEKKVNKIIIGFPISPNSQENQVCKEIKKFANKLRDLFSLEIIFQNEKFSTKEGLALKTKKEKRADHLAAAKILEYYLDKL